MSPGVQDPARSTQQGSPEPHEGSTPPDRYEPLPGIAGLPKWIWARLPRAARVGLALLPVAAVALALLLGPGIDESKDERAQAERERLGQLDADRVEHLSAEQRPRFRRGAPAGEDLAARASLVAALPAAIRADARERVAAGTLDGPIRDVRCEPYPRSVSGRGAHLDPGQATGRYSCLAVTSTIAATEAHEGGVIGHPYRALVHFDTGRYAFCKVSGRPGEGSLARRGFVTVPAACGGR